MVVTLTLGYVVVTECIYLSSGAGSRFGLFCSRSEMLATLLGTGVLGSWGRDWSVGSEMALWRQYSGVNQLLPLFFSLAISSCSSSILICFSEHASGRGTDTRRYQVGFFSCLIAELWPSLFCIRFIEARRGSVKGSSSGAVSFMSADADGDSGDADGRDRSKFAPSATGFGSSESFGLRGSEREGGTTCDQESIPASSATSRAIRGSPC